MASVLVNTFAILPYVVSISGSFAECPASKLVVGTTICQPARFRCPRLEAKDPNFRSVQQRQEMRAFQEAACRAAAHPDRLVPIKLLALH